MSFFQSMLARALNRGRRTSTVRPPGIYLGTGRPLIGSGEPRPMCLPLEPPRHMAVFGRTGTGKSTLLLTLMLEYHRTGIPFLFIDPHGQTADDFLGLIVRKGLAGKGNKINPFEPGNEVKIRGWNALATRGQVPHRTVRGLVTTLQHFWADSWGPRMQEVLTMALLPLATVECTLLEVVPFLTVPEFRRAVLQHVNIPEVREFWRLRFERMSLSQRSTVVEPVLNKLSVFYDPAMKYVLGQQHGTLDLDRALAEGETIIANFSSAHLYGNNYLLAALLLEEFRGSVFRRPTGAKRYVVLLDEFQEMIGWSALDAFLRGGRKFNESTDMATQDLPAAMRAPIFTNCSVIIVFASSAADAAFLGKEFGGAEGALVAERLPELKTGQAFVKVRGEPVRLLQVHYPGKPTQQEVQQGRAMCAQHGKDVAEIDAEIEQRRQRFMPSASLARQESSHFGQSTDLPEGYEG